MKKANTNNKNLFKIGVIVLALVFLISSVFLLIAIWDRQHGLFPASTDEEPLIEYNGTKYVQKKNLETFLVLGLDKFDGASSSDSYNNDKQADFMMLFVIDNSAKKYTAIHINRDTMAEINVLGVAGNKIDTVTKQITLAHTYGNGKDVSCRNAADSVSKLLLGTKVNHYISLTMDSVSVMNDLVGGVEVSLLEDFTEVDPALIKGETITLNGEQALKYVRSRYGLDDPTNNTRMVRQQQYIEALYKKVKECIEKDEEFIVNSSLQMSDYIISDRSVTQLQDLIKKFGEYEFSGIKEIDGETKVGEKYMEFYPDEDSIKQIVYGLFYEPER